MSLSLGDFIGTFIQISRAEEQNSITFLGLKEEKEGDDEATKSGSS